MAADWWPLQTSRPACACEAGSRRLHRYLSMMCNAQRPQPCGEYRCRRSCQPLNAHVTASAPPTTWWRRQCRTGWPKAPQLTPATGSGRPHDVRKGIIRRQAAGLARRTRERVGMRLATTSWQGHCSALSEIISRAICEVLAVGSILGDTRLCRMRMARHLGFREGRFPDSAGQSAG